MHCTLWAIACLFLLLPSRGFAQEIAPPIRIGHLDTKVLPVQFSAVDYEEYGFVASESVNRSYSHDSDGMRIRDVNLALRFALELGALGALGYWGFTAETTRIGKVGLGLGAPTLAAVAWGIFGSPNAPVPVSGAARLGLEVAIFGSATAALVDAGHPKVAGVFAVLVVVNRILMYVWGQ